MNNFTICLWIALIFQHLESRKRYYILKNEILYLKNRLKNIEKLEVINGI